MKLQDFSKRLLDYFLARKELLGSGRLYFYEHGSLQPVAVYFDESLTTVHCNPIVLDMQGNIPNVWKEPGKIVDVKLTDRNGKDIAFMVDPFGPQKCPTCGK